MERGGPDMPEPRRASIIKNDWVSISGMSVDCTLKMGTPCADNAFKFGVADGCWGS